ncbi:MAG TPA: ABC transporter permease subunit [Acidimicrobiia bacterium]|nr:ABC transporter permease subunit [Acidimicrobiia bacterium]
MTAATQTDPLELLPAGGNGWTIGLSNLLRKEFGQWFTTKLWWIQTLIWVFILNGVTTVIMLDSSGMAADELMRESVQTYFLVGATSIGIGIVLTLQGAIVGEREMGTAAWVVSKPASRTAFVASKLIAHFTGFALTAIVIPSVVFLITARLLLPQSVAYGPFAMGVAVTALNVLFFVTLTLALGCLFKGRGPIAGIGITLILMGQFFKGMLPETIVMATPWLLGDVAASFAIQQPPAFNRTVPMIVAAAEIVILALVGIWRFNREEF